LLRTPSVTVFHFVNSAALSFAMAVHAVSAIGYSLFPLSGSGYDGSVQSFIHVYIVTVLVVISHRFLHIGKQHSIFFNSGPVHVCMRGRNVV